MKKISFIIIGILLLILAGDTRRWNEKTTEGRPEVQKAGDCEAGRPGMAAEMPATPDFLPASLTSSEAEEPTPESL